MKPDAGTVAACSCVTFAGFRTRNAAGTATCSAYVPPFHQPSCTDSPKTSSPTANSVTFRPIDSTYYPTFRFVKAHNAGNVALTGLDPNVTYAVSIAALNERGLVSGFSSEQFIGPGAAFVAPVDISSQP